MHMLRFSFARRRYTALPPVAPRAVGAMQRVAISGTGIFSPAASAAWMLIMLISGGPLMSSPVHGRPLRIVTTIPDLASIASAVGGDQVRVRSIAQGHENPHFLQARPSFVVAARDADLWIRAGMELEVGWEPVLLESARNPRILPGSPGFLDISEHIPVRLEVPEGPITRAQGDVHPSGNPHYLLDPLNARAAARAIAERLAQLRPEAADIFRVRANDFARRVDEHMFGSSALEKADGDFLWSLLLKSRLDDWLHEHRAAPGGWWAATAPVRGRPIVTSHKSFTYLTHRFGLVEAIHLEPVPGVPPGPAHLSLVIERMVADGIRTILVEPFYPLRPAEFVASRTGARIRIVSTYAPDAHPDAWFRMMERLVEAVSEP